MCMPQAAAHAAAEVAVDYLPPIKPPVGELGAAAYYVGAFGEGRAAIERALASGGVPAGQRPRLEANLAFYPPAG